MIKVYKKEEEKMKNNKKLKVFCLLTAFCFSMGSAKAASKLMTWEGTGIIGKASIQSFYGQGQKIKIVNNITGAYNPNVAKARLVLRKYELIGKSTAKTMIQTGLGQDSWTYTTGKNSRYDMYFEDCSGMPYPNPLNMNGYIE